MNSVEINSDMPDPLWWLRRPRHKNADLVSNPNTFVMCVGFALKFRGRIFASLSRHVIEPNYLCDRPVDCVSFLLASRGPDGDTQQAECGLRAVLFRGLTYTLSGKS